jgi:UDP-glucose 4-epimerase
MSHENANKSLKILVTGGAGFIGSNVVDAYIEEGHKVVILDNLVTGSLDNVNPKATFIKMDIKDKQVEDVFKKYNFDVVNHHAAQIDVRTSIEDPVFDASVNILGALNIYENCRKYGVKKIIFISSGGAIYGECDEPKDENADKDPISPYGITKYTNEFYIKFYANIYGLKYTILRYANVYGPRQNPKGEAGVVSIFSTRMLQNDDVCIYGDGEQKRDYVFVGDVVKANVKSLYLKHNDIFNVGTEKMTSVNELFESMAKVYGYKKAPKYLAKRDGELQRSVLNISKIKKEYQLEPRDLSEGLKITADYYKDKV